MNESERRELAEDIKSEIRSELGGSLSKLSNNRMLLWLNIAATVLGLLTFIYKIGKTQAATDRAILDQATLASRVSSIEATATFGAREYMAQDRAWTKATEERLARIELLSQTVSTIQADVVRIKTLLESHTAPIKP